MKKTVPSVEIIPSKSKHVDVSKPSRNVSDEELKKVIKEQQAF